jgi:hypothetical protein
MRALLLLACLVAHGAALACADAPAVAPKPDRATAGEKQREAARQIAGKAGTEKKQADAPKAAPAVGMKGGLAKVPSSKCAG